jgi:hypothetical protein
MNMNDIENALTRHQELIDLAEEFVRFKDPTARRGNVRINGGLVEEYVNTVCHCHPEYEWIARGSVEEFSEWMSKRES